jgi:sugar phosphate isomerase/epimerase
MTNPALDIRIGTMVRCGIADPAAYVRAILPLGFESIQPFFWQTLGGKDIPRLAGELREAIGAADVSIDTIGMFGNPLEDGEVDRATLHGWETLIDHAHRFGASTIAGFTGRVRGQPINEVSAPNLGLEWEPCHQLVYLIDPLPQIRKWAAKIFHVHGKDATVRWEVIREHGIFGKHRFVFMRTPGFGDSNWTDVISELRLAGYKGSIDIEGWHDPVYRDALEMTGQVRALNYLKECRGGAFVRNPA